MNNRTHLLYNRHSDLRVSGLYSISCRDDERRIFGKLIVEGDLVSLELSS